MLFKVIVVAEKSFLEKHSGFFWQTGDVYDVYAVVERVAGSASTSSSTTSFLVFNENCQNFLTIPCHKCAPYNG